MELPSFWFLCRDPQDPNGDIRLNFAWEHNLSWENGHLRTDLDTQVLWVFSPTEEGGGDVVELLNTLYMLDCFVTGPDGVSDWRFKTAIEKIIKAAVNVTTPSALTNA